MHNDSISTVEITPGDFERQIKAWLQGSSHGLKNFRIDHLKKLEGHGGEYEIDAVAEFEVLGGAAIVVLVECKYYKNPVKRDVVMLLDAKVRDTGSHKGIVFTTSGFQSGALEYAKTHGIATVVVEDGRGSYETKSADRLATPPPWRPNYKYLGWMLSIDENGNESYHRIDDDYHDAIDEWLRIGEA